MGRETVSGPLANFSQPGSVVETEDKKVFMVLSQDKEGTKVRVAPLGLNIKRGCMQKYEERDFEAERQVTYRGNLPVGYLDMPGVDVPKSDSGPALFLRIKRKGKESFKLFF